MKLKHRERGFQNCQSHLPFVQHISGSPVTLTLNTGYYDDFSLDYNWAVSGASPNVWERAIPIATLNGADICNPGNDVAVDCGDYAYVTDNGGGGAWANDVDFGTAILTSPVFDATLYTDPFLQYTRWYYNGGTTNGNPDDTMKVYLDNGLTRVLLETANPSSPDNSTWADRSFNISSLITPTNSMRFILSVRDSNPISNIVEGGLDHFSITEGVSSINDNSSPELQVSAHPNPFNNQIKLQYNLKEFGITATITIFDMLGHEIFQSALKNTIGEVITGDEWPAGIYMVKLSSLQGNKSMLITKSEK